MRYDIHYTMCHHITPQAGENGKRLRDDAKQCKIVLLRYAKALDNIIVIKCN